MSTLQDSSLFISQVHDRAHHFVRSGIWGPIEEARLRNWIRQFEQYGAELLGAILLDNLIFKSKSQLRAILSTLMTGADLCDGMRHDCELVESLGSFTDPGIRMAPAISLSQPPTKSGFYVLRLLQRMYRIRNGWLVWPQKFDELPAVTRLLIIVDDFLGSGNQFSTFAELSKLAQLRAKKPELRIVYLVAVAHQSGIDSVRKEFPYVEVICGEVLNDDFHVFRGERLNQRYRANISEGLEIEYLALAKKAGLPLNGTFGPFGYGQQGLCYGFEHGTPNNTLPAFWYETPVWTTLLDR